MRSGSPFYHFKSKGALLYAVMEEGMRSAIERQQQALRRAERATPDIAGQLRILIRNHFDVLLGPGSDFIPVMLYESRSITPRQRAVLTQLQSEYEVPWTPVLDALHASGQLKADVKLARLLIFGALNWSAQWYDRRKGASLDELTDAAMGLVHWRRDLSASLPFRLHARPVRGTGGRSSPAAAPASAAASRTNWPRWAPTWCWSGASSRSCTTWPARSSPTAAAPASMPATSATRRRCRTRCRP